MTNRFQTGLLSLLIGVGLSPSPTIAEPSSIIIPHMHSGVATIRQRGRTTILEVKLPGRPSQRIALSHPSDYRQGTNPPYRVRLIAESAAFLIFTDTFASNPGNPQGQCGASDTGERFVHVVALGAIPHETLSVLMDSCLLDLEAAPQSPKWIEKTDSAGFIGRLILRFEQSGHPTVAYYVSPDGSVTRPEHYPDSPNR